MHTFLATTFAEMGTCVYETVISACLFGGLNFRVFSFNFVDDEVIVNTRDSITANRLIQCGRKVLERFNDVLTIIAKAINRGM